ncbi:MAG: hypothetical protein ABJB12_12450 [Pseudomonadota bacterium]
MMSPANVRHYCTQRALLACVCLCVGVLYCERSRAQSSSVEPALWPLPPSQAPARDRPSAERNSPAGARADEHVKVGALLGVSFPRPLSVEGLVKLERAVAVGVEYSTLPDLTVSNVQVGCWAVAGSARVFPFRGPFFVGLRAGRQHLTAAAAVSAYGYNVPVGLSVDTTFLDPQVGFMWTWSSGITLGIDAGLQVPLSSQSASTLQATVPTVAEPYVASARQDAENVAKAIGQTPLPTVDLIRFGFLF